MMIESPVPVHSPIREERASLHRARNERASEALARVREREQIGAKVAHELKNPLTGVKALVQLGLRNPAEAASHQRLAIIEPSLSEVRERAGCDPRDGRMLGEAAYAPDWLTPRT